MVYVNYIINQISFKKSVKRVKQQNQEYKMSFSNPYQQNQQSNIPQKLSIIYIEQAYFHRIEIKSLASLYKLNVKLKKPIILSFHGLPVMKYICDHVQSINTVIQMDNIHELKFCVPGYGIFNQKYQLERLSTLFLSLAQYGQNICQNLKKLTIQFPGWRTFSSDIISNIFQFIKKCKLLEQFSLNLNYAMSLSDASLNSKIEQQPNSAKNELQTFYGQYMFRSDQFQILMKCITSLLPKNSLSKLELRFGAWQCVNSSILQKLVNYLEILYQKYKNLRTLKLDLHGWGKGNYENPDDQIKMEMVENFFKIIEQIDGDNSQLLEIDMRNWPEQYKISKFKERFMYLNGGWKKREDGQTNSNLWSMTGTVFFGSQLRSKIANKIRVEIID